MNLRSLPNVISVARMLLVAPLMWAILRRADEVALLLIVIAGLSDALDGLLAKRFGWTSPLGALLDPLADKLLMVGSFLAALIVGLIPMWLTALVIGRDLLIVGGAALFRWRTGEFRPQPSLLSKVNTFLQIALVCAVIARGDEASVPFSLVLALVAAVTLSTLASGVDYTIRWGRRLARAGRERGV